MFEAYGARLFGSYVCSYIANYYLLIFLHISARLYKSQISILQAEIDTISSSDRGFVPKPAASGVSLGRLSSGSEKVEQPDTALYEEIPEVVAPAPVVTTEIQCIDNAAYQVGLRKN